MKKLFTHTTFIICIVFCLSSAVFAEESIVPKVSQDNTPTFSPEKQNPVRESELPKGGSSNRYYPDRHISGKQDPCEQYFDEKFAQLKDDLCVCPEVSCRMDGYYKSLKACARPLLGKLRCQNAELCKIITSDCCCVGEVRTQKKCIKDTVNELKECVRTFEEDVRWELDWRTRMCFNKWMNCEKKELKEYIRSLCPCDFSVEEQKTDCAKPVETQPAQKTGQSS